MVDTLFKRRWFAPAALLSLCFLANFNILSNGFVSDDTWQVKSNHCFRNPSSHGVKFTEHVWGFMGPTYLSNYYRPLMHVLNMGCYLLFGPQPWGFHLVSILLHAGCTVLVFYVGLELELSPPTSFLAAMLFAVHPVHTEAIAWVGANTELASALLVLTAFYLHLRGQKWWSILTFLLALFTRETAIVLLPMLVAGNLARGGKPVSAKVFDISPFYLVPVAIYLPMRLYAMGGLVMYANQFATLPGSAFLYSDFYLIGNYLRYLVDPFPPNFYHEFFPVLAASDWRFQAGLTATLAVLALVWLLWRRGSRLWFAVVWILVPLVPALFFHRVVSLNVFTERYLYLPSVGYCWLLAALLMHWERAGPELLRKLLRKLHPAVVAGALLVTVGAAATWRRNADYRDDLKLSERTLEVSPDSSVVRADLAGICLANSQTERAAELFRQAARIKPLEGPNRIHYGIALARMGRLQEARVLFDEASRMMPRWPVPWYNLGLVSESEKDRAGAELNYRRALLRDPGYYPAHENLGSLLAEDGRLDEAEHHFRVARSLVNLGKLLTMRGRAAAAEDAYRNAIRDDSNNAEAFYLLAGLLRRSGRVAESEQYLREMQRALPASNWRPPKP